MTSSDITSGTQATRRRSTKTALSAVALGLMLASGITGCGGDDSASSQPKQQEPVLNGGQRIVNAINSSGHAEYLGSVMGSNSGRRDYSIPAYVAVKEKATGDVLSCNVIEISDNGHDGAAIFCSPGKNATFKVSW